MYNGKSYHIRRRHNTIREFLSSKIITIDYVKSKDNVSDPLTKGLTREGVERTSKGMGLRPRTSQHGDMDVDIGSKLVLDMPLLLLPLSSYRLLFCHQPSLLPLSSSQALLLVQQRLSQCGITSSILKLTTGSMVPVTVNFLSFVSIKIEHSGTRNRAALSFGLEECSSEGQPAHIASEEVGTIDKDYLAKMPQAKAW
ncbi:hypothetical protein FXO38_27844 [Capsicum annuum]|nr:hypothetical protein FXO37_33700 [Capsicum annuum]KAF3629162.1 hypothetical protein FXO38_27844 [Capsicum annuum]